MDSVGFPGVSTPSGQEDTEDLSIPRAAINKMIKDTVPSFRVANDARDLITNCCTEFIRLIATEANEICERDQKKTISPEHVLGAMDKAGFSAEYRQEAMAVYRDCKEVVAKRRRGSMRLENLGISEEELLRQQQELFARAREAEKMNIESDWVKTQDALMQRDRETTETNSSGRDNDDDDDYD